MRKHPEAKISRDRSGPLIKNKGSKRLRDSLLRELLQSRSSLDEPTKLPHKLLPINFRLLALAES
jgi:hypothetical protein